MSWLLKQAEDILNRVDQQTNAAIHQHGVKPTSKQTKEESASDSSSINSTTRDSNSTNRSSTSTRRTKKNDDLDLIDYLNSSTPAQNKSNRPVSVNNLLTDAARTSSVPDMLWNDSSKTTEQLSSKSASGTPRSVTPAAQPHDEDEGLVLVRLTKIC